MKLIVLAVKGIKESLRDKKNFAFLMIFPLMFLVLFRVAFGWGPESTETYDIVVLDEDDGIGPWVQTDPEWLEFLNMMNGTDYNGTEFFQEEILMGHATGGEFLIEEVLNTARYEDTGKRMFNVIVVESRSEAEDMIKDEEAACMVVIPANYSSSLQGNVDLAVVEEMRAHGVPINMSSEEYAHALVDLSGPLGSFDFSFAASLVQGQIYGYTQAMYATIRYTVGSGFPEGPIVLQGGSIGVLYVSVGDTEEFTVFDWQAPGIVIFALMMTAIYVSLTLATEVKNRTLQRLRLTKMSAMDMMGGTTLRWLFVGAFQTVVLVLVVLALGTKVAGDVGPTMAYVFIIAMVAILASIALGLIISSFVDDPEQAGNIGTAIVVPMSFLTGAFFPMDVAAAQLLPWTQASLALKQVMLYADWEVAATHTMYAFVAATVVFVIGVVLFQRKRLRA
ncbi:MAG: ABC transporter permease [Thermoplasmata archaeon]|nr:ABC transporter permease [Thermoplasmata archaeon]